MTDTFDAIGRRLSDSQKATSDDAISFSIIKYNENTTNEPQHPFINEQDDCSKVRNELKNVRNRLEEQERINETLMRKIEALEQKESEVSGTESSTVRPLAVATIIIKYPCCIIIAVLLLTIIAFAIDATVFEFHDGGGLEYFITSAENTGKMFAYWVAVASAQEDAGSAPVKTLEQSHFQITTLFKTRDGSDILQPQYLPFIQEINDKIVHSDYDEYYRLCLSDSASFPDCSSTAITDPLIQGLFSSKSISDISQQDIDNLVSSSINISPVVAVQFYVHFESSFANSTNQESQYYRAFFVEYIHILYPFEPIVVCQYPICHFFHFSMDRNSDYHIPISTLRRLHIEIKTISGSNSGFIMKIGFFQFGGTFN